MSKGKKLEELPGQTPDPGSHNNEDDAMSENTSESSLILDSLYHEPGTLRFQVGKEKKVFEVPSELILKAKSFTLMTLMNNPMKEARERIATLEDTDSKTSELFLHYVRLGDYHVQHTSRRVISSHVRNSWHDRVYDQDWQTAWEDFKWDPRYRRDPSTMVTLNLDDPEQEQPRSFHFFYRTHARLYVFADKYGVVQLRALILRKLHAWMCGAPALSQDSLISMCSYAFKHSAEP